MAKPRSKPPSRPSAPRGSALIGQSGGPTAVINQSLLGVIEGLRAMTGGAAVKKVYGMRHGVNGLVKDPPDLADLSRTGLAHLKGVAGTPSAALGSSRDKPDAEYCRRILDACERLEARYFFYIGGNDSSDTCRIVSELARASGSTLRCFHVPKTVDNDLVGSDHTPGYPSAARFQALAFMADSMDNASLPGVKINVVMGRHAGFLTAAAALAKGDGKDRDRNGPHLIYLPEITFDSGRFIAEVEAVYARLGRCQVAVSEGIQDSMGRPIATSLVQGLDRDAHGNVQLSGVSALGDALADLIKKNVKVGGAGGGGKAPRVRADTFGYLQRCWPDPSPVDVKEAWAVGRFAARLAARGGEGGRHGSVAIVREGDRPYRASLRRIELTEVAAKTRHMPPEFIEGTSGVTRAFIKYATPLVGRLPVMTRL